MRQEKRKGTPRNAPWQRCETIGPVTLYQGDCRKVMAALASDGLAVESCKPGGHCLAFAGSRTYHRIASAIENAGFEIRDQLMWIYGSGFPKSPAPASPPQSSRRTRCRPSSARSHV